MLKGIPAILPPELLKILMEMGHGDELLLADANYPRLGQPERVIRCDGHGVPEILDAILELMPLDQYVEKPAALMATGNDPRPVIWDQYLAILEDREPDNHQVEEMERFAFYDRAKKAYAIVATGETAVYANILLKKGVVK